MIHRFCNINIFFQMVKIMTVKKLSTTQQVTKKHLKRHVKRLRDREYTRLRQMVPSIAENEKVSKVYKNKLFQQNTMRSYSLSF